MSDNFTGSDGTAVSTSNWTGGFTGSASASAKIQTNKGRWLTGTGTGYTFSTKGISRSVNITIPADVDISGTYTPHGEVYPGIFVRDGSSPENFDGNAG